MPSSKTICIFCASSDKTPQHFQDIAQQTGRLCADLGFNVVYGGAAGGLMGLMANAALQSGAYVTGVMPQCLESQERAHKSLSRLIITKDLHERQKTMADLSDIFLVLPGGLGTLAEFFEILTWKQIGLHKKPIIVLNASGFWDGLISTLNDMENQGFLHKNTATIFDIVPNIQNLQKFLENIQK